MPVSEVAGMLKLVDRPDLGSGVERRVGSSPTTCTARDFPLISSTKYKYHHPHSVMLWVGDICFIGLLFEAYFLYESFLIPLIYEQ